MNVAGLLREVLEVFYSSTSDSKDGDVLPTARLINLIYKRRRWKREKSPLDISLDTLSRLISSSLKLHLSSSSTAFYCLYL